MSRFMNALEPAFGRIGRVPALPSMNKAPRWKVMAIWELAWIGLPARSWTALAVSVLVVPLANPGETVRSTDLPSAARAAELTVVPLIIKFPAALAVAA